MKQNGLNHRGTHPSEESRKKMSESHKGAKNPNYGKPRSEEAKRKIGEANSLKNMSEETRKKRSESKKKKIVAIENTTKEIRIFDSLSDAANFFKVSASTVTRWCKKQRNPSVNYTFDYLNANND